MADGGWRPSAIPHRLSGRNARRHRRRAFPFVLASLLLLVVGVLPVAAADPSPTPSGRTTWAIQPSTATGPDGRSAFEYELPPGGSVLDHVGVSNLGDAPLTLVLYATDAFTTSDGGFALLTRDEAPTGVGSWIETAASEFVIEPGTRLDIPFRLTVPSDAEPGDQVGGIVASLESRGSDGQGNDVVVERRVGTRIYLRVEGEVDAGLRIDPMEADYDAGWNPISGTLTVRFTVTNIGNIRLAAGQAASASGPFGAWSKALDLDDLPEILPGGSVIATTTFTGVPPLIDIAASIRLDPYPTGQGVTASVPPVEAVAHAWALPILLTGIVLLAVEAIWLFIRWRRRRAAAERQRFEDAVAAATARGIEIGRSGEAPPAEAPPAETPSPDPPAREPPDA